jgi:glucuronate isomerase
LAWILASVAVSVGMRVALMVMAFVAGIHVPSDKVHIDPIKVAETAPFNDPSVIEAAPGHYETCMVVGI